MPGKSVHFRLPCLALAAVVLGACAGYVESGPPGKPRADKVAICHKGKKTIYVAEPAAEAHYRHGDRPGPCR